jgi:PAS domain S-box-containing protein
MPFLLNVPQAMIAATAGTEQGALQQQVPQPAGWTWSVLAVGLLVLAVIVGGSYLVQAWRRRRSSRFERMFENAPTPMLLLDQDLRVVQVNGATERLLGKDVLRRNFQHVLQHLGKPDWTNLPERVEKNESISFEATREHEEGAPTYYRVEMSNMEIAEASYYLTSVYDVTDDREKATLFRQFHRQTISQLPLEVAILTPEGQYLHANDEFAQGRVSMDWLTQKTDVDLCKKMGWHPEVALRRRSHRKRAAAMNERVHLQESLSMPDDDTRRYFDRFYAPMLDQQGEVYAIATFGLDRTALEEKNERIRKLNEGTDDFQSLKARFLENLSHEFRTPLTGIKGAAEILEQEVPDEQQDLVDIIGESGRRLLNSLNAMLDLAGLDADELDMRPQVLNLSEKSKAVVEDLQEEAAEKSIFLRAHAMQDEVLARLDPSSLQRVLHGLIGNAVKFTDEGGVFVEIDESDGRAEVRIMDTGVGIEDEFLPHLFDEFRQEQNSMGGNFEGVGVGLAVVKRLIDMMDGEVSVDTEKGEGTMFTISFPKAFTDVTDEEEHRPHLLAIENDPDAQQLFRRLLEPHFQADFARDLEAVRKRTQLTAYDVVLMDVRLHEKRAAADLISELRAFDGLETRPVVAIDKQGAPGAREQYVADGFDHYLDEPFEKQALLSTLGDALSSAEVLSQGQR